MSSVKIMPTTLFNATASTIDLQWRALNYKLGPQSQADGADFRLMEAHGHAQTGRLLSIMGQSGAGKTTLVRACPEMQPHVDVKMQGHARPAMPLLVLPRGRQGIQQQCRRQCCPVSVMANWVAHATLRLAVVG